MTEQADLPRTETIARLITEHQHRAGALLPLLHAIQDAIGFVPPDAVAPIAAALNLSRAEVHGVITFYHHFRTEAGGHRTLQLCRAEACKSMGGDALWKHACAHLQLSEHEAQHGATTADRRFSLQPVYCLGLCSTAPALALDEQLHGRVQASDLDRLLAGSGSAA